MAIVLGLLNNISYVPQSGGRFCTQGGGVVAVSNLTAVIEKKAAISIGNGVPGKFKVSVKENQVPTEKNSSRASIFATKASYISN